MLQDVDFPPLMSKLFILIKIYNEYVNVFSIALFISIWKMAAS